MILWSFFIAAEKIRRALGLGKIIHLIADAHATTNEFTDLETVEASAASVCRKVLSAVSRLGLLGVYEVKLASELAKEPGYAEELAAISGPEHDYVKQELADISFLRKTQSVVLKLSWQQESKKIEFDERLFDRLFQQRFGPCMSFVYLKAGRSFDSSSLNVCPYTAKAGQKRILIGAGKTASEIIAEMAPFSKSTKQTLQHLETIVDEFDQVFGICSKASHDLGYRIDELISRLFG